MTDTKTQNGRTADARVLPLLLDRWSPRSFDESIIPDEDLAVMFEAAGWAPSAYNYQPWKFLYAKREDTAEWERFLAGLIPFNQGWAKTASVLVYAVSDTQMGEGDKATEGHSHSFDTGSAWALLSLQATAMGYHTHGMTGVDWDAVRLELGVPDRFRLDAAFVIGRQDSADKLPEGLREREVPSDRKPVSEIAVRGNFKA